MGRKALSAKVGCNGCQRHNQELQACGEAQKPHSGGFCKYWWDSSSRIKAPEIKP